MKKKYSLIDNPNLYFYQNKLESFPNGELIDNIHQNWFLFSSFNWNIKFNTFLR